MVKRELYCEKRDFGVGEYYQVEFDCTSDFLVSKKKDIEISMVEYSIDGIDKVEEIANFDELEKAIFENDSVDMFKKREYIINFSNIEGIESVEYRFVISEQHFCSN